MSADGSVLKVTALSKGKTDIVVNVDGRDYVCQITVEAPAMGTVLYGIRNRGRKRTDAARVFFFIEVDGCRFAALNLFVRIMERYLVRGVSEGNGYVNIQVNGKTYKCVVKVKRLCA